MISVSTASGLVLMLTIMAARYHKVKAINQGIQVNDREFKNGATGSDNDTGLAFWN